jgi:F-type H+-transporting ATPase subunit b
MLLSPDFGLLFWMLFSFGIVFFVLAKFGFPVITKMVEERRNYIQESLDAAGEANQRFAAIEQQCDELMSETKAEQVKILRQAAETRDRIVSEARDIAKVEGMKELQSFRRQTQIEKQQAMRDLRREISEISVDVAEKVLRQSLDTTPAQLSMIDRLVNEALTPKT